MKKMKYSLICIIIIFFVICIDDINTRYSYNIIKHVYKKENADYSIEYPQIKEFKDSKIQTKVNQIIKKYVIETWEERYGVIEDINCTLEYNIKRKDNILSILYYGWYWGNITKRNHVAFTINIDMKNGVKIDLKEKFINNKIEEKIKFGNFKVVAFKDYYKYYRNEYENKNIISQIEKSTVDEDILYLNNVDKIGVIIPSYNAYFIIEIEQR